MVDDYKKLEEEKIKFEQEKEKREKEMKEKMKKSGIEEIIRTEVKKFSKSAHITLPKQFLGKKAVVFIIDEEVVRKNHRTSQNATK